MKTPLAVLVLSLALAACGDQAAIAPRDDPTTPPGSSAPSIAADALVLGVSYEGGFGPFPPPAALPFWSLYGDGRVVTIGPQPAIYPGPALPNLQVAKVSTETVERIAAAAREAGVDGTQRDYGNPPIADASTTVFRLSDEQGTVETQVYALAEADDVDNEPRRKLRELLDRLTDLDKWFGEGTVTDAGAYEPVTVAVFASRYRGDDADVAPKEQAWDGADPAAGAQTASGRCTLVTGDALAKAMPAFRGATANTRWTYDGTDWAFQLRPLLPDERTCQDALD